MPLLVPNHGESDGLRAFVGQDLSDLSLGLYTNNITPAETDTAATYTVATFTGYAAIDLANASWTFTEGAPSLAEYAEQRFQASANGQNAQIYGLIMTRSTGGRIAVAERFASGPYLIDNIGDYLDVTPRITFD